MMDPGQKPAQKFEALFWSGIPRIAADQMSVEFDSAANSRGGLPAEPPACNPCKYAHEPFWCRHTCGCGGKGNGKPSPRKKIEAPDGRQAHISGFRDEHGRNRHERETRHEHCDIGCKMFREPVIDLESDIEEDNTAAGAGNVFDGGERSAKVTASMRIRADAGSVGPRTKTVEGRAPPKKSKKRPAPNPAPARKPPKAKTRKPPNSADRGRNDSFGEDEEEIEEVVEMRRENRLDNRPRTAQQLMRMPFPAPFQMPPSLHGVMMYQNGNGYALNQPQTLEVQPDLLKFMIGKADHGDSNANQLLYGLATRAIKAVTTQYDL